MILPGLSPEQAPPFSIPLRFFLTAPLFLAVAGLVAAAQPGWSTDVRAPLGLALTHLVTLGFLGMVMLGALTQMLPVVVGAPLPRVRWVAGLGHLGLLLGTPLLAWGLAVGERLPLLAAGVLLGAGLLPFLLAAGVGLLRGRSLDTARAMALALSALALTLACGLALLSWQAGLWRQSDPLAWLNVHVLAGLAGWVGLLVLGVAWQVVPMLQLTPAYPPLLTWPLLFTAAAGLLLAWLPAGPGRLAGQLTLSATAIVFAATTLHLQGRRKRRIPDVALAYWRLGMLCLIAAAVLLPLADSPAPLALAGLLFLLGFAASVVNAMLCKIVPFLAWFHLQGQRGLFAVSLPGMKDFLPDAAARAQFRLHLAALVCLLLTPFLPLLAVPGGLLLAAAALWLGWILARTAYRFRTQGGRF